MQETFSTIRPGPGGRFCAEKPRSCCLPGGSFTCVSAAANSCLPLREACRLNGLPTVPLKRRKSIMLTRASRAENEAPANGEYRGEPKRTAVVWFKRDLRIDDHPGLATASSYSHVIPLFVYDPVLLSGIFPLPSLSGFPVMLPFFHLAHITAAHTSFKILLADTSRTCNSQLA